MLRRISGLATVFTVLLLASPAFAQPPEGRGRREGGPPAEGKEDAKGSKGIQPYDKVIPEDAKSDPGLFLVHRVEDKVFYEIPQDAFDKDMLWVVQIEKIEAGYGYGGTPVGDRVVRWELRDEKVLLRDVQYQIRADVDDPIRRAVEATSLAPILEVFPVKAWGKDKAPVIEVTDFFLGDPDEFSPKRRLSASGIDKGRSFIEEVLSFPRNIETRLLATYKLSGGSDRTSSFPFPRQGPRRDPTLGAVTALVHHSMVLLPENPMKPRRADDRVGFFTVSFDDYGSPKQQVETVEYINRWRLEKKDPQAEVSEPKDPIVFYVGRGVPGKWRPWVKKGIEAWQPAFEAAGFKNAILAKDAPSPQEDPEWSAEDARISTIRWLPSNIENAMGPHVHDPRTGEILEADVLIYHNVQKLARDWYFVQTSPNDERAQKLPMPDDLLGELLAYVVAHEVGHSLGFPHNMKASSAYTVEQLRDPEFTKKNGTEASIMDYGRFNYVAQPGDGAALIPIIGPYDFFAIEWGYREYPDDEAEAKGLAEIVGRQVDNPVLRFGDADPSEDPLRQTEDLGSDSIRATELGLANLERVAGYLVAATCKEGENYDQLRNMYDQVLAQRDRELGHVVAVVGGVNRENLWFGQADRIYHPVADARQREAVAFLNEHAFRVPEKLVDPGILARLEPNGAAERILSSQSRILGMLLADGRLTRMAELTGGAKGNAYTPSEMLGDLRNGIWSELAKNPVTIDLYRRNLQRAYVEALIGKVEADETGSDVTALARGELRALQAALEHGKDLAGDDVTGLHLQDILVRIQRALDPLAPRPAPAAPSSGATMPRRGGSE